MSLLNIELPKWPQMFVTGQPVTEEQAFDIILKTDRFLTDAYDLSGGNNHVFNCQYRVDAQLDRIWAHENRYILNDVLRERIGFIHTNYIENEWGSCSFIFGAHGWCHSNGNIFYEDNIGKWPSVQEVYDDWEKIAQAFPYLDLVVTLMSGERCDDNKVPLVSFIVKNGLVEVQEGNLDLHKDHSVFPRNEDDYWANFENRYECEIGLPDEWYERYANIVEDEVLKLLQEKNHDND